MVCLDSRHGWFISDACRKRVRQIGIRLRQRGQSFVRHAGLVVGYASIAVGLAGVVYHLDSQFFAQWTIQSLVYTAPFAAPAAYAGLGFLLLVNRTVGSGHPEWNQ